MTNIVDSIVTIDVEQDTQSADIIERDIVVVADDAPVPQVFVSDTDTDTAVLVSDDVVVVFDQSNIVDVIAVGGQGPEGVPGPPGSNTDTKIASVAIGGHRIVILNSNNEAAYADNQTAAHRDVIYGLTLNAAAAGDELTIQLTGSVIEPSWNWVPQQPIFLGANGMLTQTPPIAPAVFRRIVAFAATGTEIVVGFRDPVTLV